VDATYYFGSLLGAQIYFWLWLSLAIGFAYVIHRELASAEARNPSFPTIGTTKWARRIIAGGVAAIMCGLLWPSIGTRFYALEIQGPDAVLFYQFPPRTKRIPLTSITALHWCNGYLRALSASSPRIDASFAVHRRMSRKARRTAWSPTSIETSLRAATARRSMLGG
jgi:hypothetical protein